MKKMFFLTRPVIFGQNERKRGKTAVIDSLKTNNGIGLKFSKNLPIINSYSLNLNLFPTADGTFNSTLFLYFGPKLTPEC